MRLRSSIMEAVSPNIHLQTHAYLTTPAASVARRSLRACDAYSKQRHLSKDGATRTETNGHQYKALSLTCIV